MGRIIIRKKIDLKILFLLVAGSLSWSLTMVKSGLIYSFGMGFWGPNGHDGIWHIALISSLSKRTWQIPVFSGETIKNYHIGFDLIIAWIHKFTIVPAHILYFQIIPPILALLIGYFAYKFIYYWKKSNLQSFWSLFFLYFGGSLGWVVNLFRGGRIDGESLFWAQQSISTLINPPFALSLFFIFAGLYFLLKATKDKSKKFYIVSTFLFGVLIQIKVYAGILILLGLFVAGIWRILKREGIDVLKVFIGALVVSILLFSPLSEFTGASLIFKPFWFLESMVATPDRFYWPRLASALYNYNLVGNYAKAFLAYSLTLSIFIFGNFSTRVIAIFWLIKKGVKSSNYQYIDVLILAVVAAGLLIPMLFIQKGTSWNTIQFMYYSLIFSGILGGLFLGRLLNKLQSRSVKLAVIILAVFFTLPTTLGTLWYHYLPSRPPAKISNEELKALDFLSNLPDGTVLTEPFDRDAAKLAESTPPRPLSLYESTAYVSAFSKKAVFLEDEVNLEITGYDWQERREEVVKIFSDFNALTFENFLKTKKIRYYYQLKNNNNKIKDDYVNIIFENDEVVIYETI